MMQVYEMSECQNHFFKQIFLLNLKCSLCAWTIIKPLTDDGSKSSVQISNPFSEFIVIVNKFL